MDNHQDPTSEPQLAQELETLLEDKGVSEYDPDESELPEEDEAVSCAGGCGNG